MFCFFLLLMHFLTLSPLCQICNKDCTDMEEEDNSERLGGAETEVCSLLKLPFLRSISTAINIIHVCGANALAGERCLIENCHL